MARKKEKLLRMETKRSGVFVRGTSKLSLLPYSLIRLFLDLATKIIRIESEMNSVEAKKARLREELLELVHETGDALRGVDSERDGYRILAYSSSTQIFDPVLLRKALGELYSTVIFEDLILKVNLPGEQPNLRERVIAALKNALGEQYLLLVTETVNLRVDKKELGKTIRTKKIKLPPEAMSVITTWNVKVSPLK